MGDARFTPVYADVRDSKNRIGHIQRLTDEAVIEALAGASSAGDLLVSNLLATEALNRIRRGRRVVDSLHEGVVATDREGKVTSMNPAAERMLGWMREDVTGRDLADIAFVRREQAGANALLEPVKAQRGVVFEDVAIKSGDGRQIHADMESVPMLGNGADPSGVVITVKEHVEQEKPNERLAATLRETEALLKEIHHRVKNNLQVTCSLLLLQAKRARDEPTRALFLDSVNRVRSMALVHEKLYESKDLAAIDFSAYVAELSRDIMRSYSDPEKKITMVTDVPPVLLDLDTGVNCGLIINELISNSLKHAFIGRTTGSIRVSVEPAPGDMLVLSVSDDGAGMPPSVDVDNASTMGLQVVRGLVQQLDGTISVLRSGGTDVRIVFPRVHDARDRLREVSS